MLPHQTIPLLTVTVPPASVEAFASLFQHGMLCPVAQPVLLRDLLLDLPGFSQGYLEQNVQTVFINGVAADNFDTLLAPGSTVALSAAMPGLAGAIFRRQGLHGTLRSQIRTTQPAAAAGPGFIKLKLFNKIAIDRACDILSRGALLAGPSFLDFATRRADIFQAPVQLMFAHKAIEYIPMLQLVARHPLINLQLHVCGQTEAQG